MAYTSGERYNTRVTVCRIFFSRESVIICRPKTLRGNLKQVLKIVCADEIGADVSCSDLGVLAEVVLVSVTGGARVVTHSGLISSPNK